MKTAYAIVKAPEHRFPDHPERPDRLGLLHLEPYMDLMELPVAPARMEDLQRVHTAEMLSGLQKACAAAPAIIDHAPTYVTSTSFEDALLASGAVLGCTRAVLQGKAKNAFAIVRPPGHHAEPHRAMGFCLLSNAAIAARAALADGLHRVAVIDFDVHHGNGTQACLVDEHQATFLSTHQEGIYPGTGWVNELPNARGRIVNVPLPSGTGDKGFQQIAERLMTPFVEHFKPELLIISAGYDAHWRDPLASLELTASGYYQISKKLVKLADEFCQGRIVFVLEGGYDSRNVANGIQAGLAALGGHAEPQAQDVCPYDEPDVSEWLNEVYRWHWH